MLPIRYSFAEKEIQPGLSLHLDPDVIRESEGFSAVHGSTYISATTRDNPCLARGRRIFVVVGRLDGWAQIVPTYGQDKSYRDEVIDKSGHPGWVNRPTFFDRRQVWTASIEAIVEAANRGGDLSSPVARNRVSPNELERIRASIGWAPRGDPAAPRSGSVPACLPIV